MNFPALACSVTEQNFWTSAKMAPYDISIRKNVGDDPFCIRLWGVRTDEKMYMCASLGSGRINQPINFFVVPVV